MASSPQFTISFKMTLIMSTKSLLAMREEKRSIIFFGDWIFAALRVFPVCAIYARVAGKNKANKNQLLLLLLVCVCVCVCVFETKGKKQEKNLAQFVTEKKEKRIFTTKDVASSF